MLDTNQSTSFAARQQKKAARAKEKQAGAPAKAHTILQRIIDARAADPLRPGSADHALLAADPPDRIWSDVARVRRNLAKAAERCLAGGEGEIKMSAAMRQSWLLLSRLASKKPVIDDTAPEEVVRLVTESGGIDAALDRAVETAGYAAPKTSFDLVLSALYRGLVLSHRGPEFPTFGGLGAAFEKGQTRGRNIATKREQKRLAAAQQYINDVIALGAR